MSNIKDFNFYQFFQDITNQSIEPLQGNERYNDLVRGMEFIFNKLYRRVQEIKLDNILDLSSDNDFQKYIPNNMKVVGDTTKPYKDVILEQLSLYLDTDHFKDTAGALMKLWQKRKEDGGLIGLNDEDIESFMEEYFIPSFKFFILNSGDLHKSKGIKILLEKIIDFYGEPASNVQSFDGAIEHDDIDDENIRFKKFACLREGITLRSLLKNYILNPVYNNADFKITHYVELGIHKFAVADGRLFISRKDREDWYILNIVDDIYKLNNDYLVIRQYKTLMIYQDNVDLYNPATQEVQVPSTLDNVTITNVEFIPKIINIEDKFKQYHENNLYFIELLIRPGGGFGCFQYNLKRIRNDRLTGTIAIETIQLNMGLTYYANMYAMFGTYPAADRIYSVDYLWLNFYDAETTDAFEFYPNPLNPSTLSCVKMAYTFVVKEVLQIAEAGGNDIDNQYDYIVKRFICAARDGYGYNHLQPGFVYQNLTSTDEDLLNKYIVQERFLSENFKAELENTLNTVNTVAVLDVFVPEVQTVSEGTEVNNINTISHRMLVIGDFDFMYVWPLSFLELDINKLTDIFCVDSSPFYKFGNDANVLFGYRDKTLGIPVVYSVKMNGFYRENSKLNINQILRGYPSPNSIPVISKIRTTDENIIVFCDRFENVSNSKSTVIILDDTNFNLSVGLRTHKLNIFYNADVRLATRANQKYFKEYDDVGGQVGSSLAEEVEVLQNTINRYSPITSERNYIQENIDMGISNQRIEELTSDNFEISIPNYDGTKNINEIVKFSAIDTFSINIGGSPDIPNCRCNDLQNTLLYLYNFNPMTYLYDYTTHTINPNLSHVPPCLKLYWVGTIKDQYSLNENACRLDTGYFYYQYNDINFEIPRLIRSRFRVNLYESFQKIEIDGVPGTLKFNWSVHCLAEILENTPLDTILDWRPIINEEVYSPVVENLECEPNRTYYTSTYNIPPVVVDAWEVFNYPAMICDYNVNYSNCDHTPWVPSMTEYEIYNKEYPPAVIPEEIEVSRLPQAITLEVWILNTWHDGFSINGTLVSEGQSYNVNINLNNGEYDPDPDLEPLQYIKKSYRIDVDKLGSLEGTNLLYNTRAPNNSNPRIGRLRMLVYDELKYDTNFKNGQVSINL